MPMQQAVAKKTSQKPPVEKVPQPESTRSVADVLGGGEARLYDAHKQGLPDLAAPPPEKQLAECQWWLVHFPSRRTVPVLAGRLEGMRLLKKLEQGKDEAGLLPPKKVKKSAKPASKGRARAGACAGAGEEGVFVERPTLRIKVDPTLSFEKALEAAFSPQFLVNEICDVLRASKPIMDKDGHIVAYQEDFMTRTTALFKLVDQAKGRAGEKPPPPPDKKRVSYQELEAMILSSPATLMHFEGLIAKAKEKQAAAAAVAAEAGG